MHHVLLVFLGVLLSPLARVRSSVAWSIALLLAIYAALYADASWDYAGYLEYFDCIRGRSCAEDVSERVELTFLATASFLGLLLGSAGGPFLVAIYSSTAVMLKLHLLSRECKSFGVALLGYLCIGWFLHEMTQIRVGLAVAFLWLAVHALSAQLRVRAVAYFGMAVLVHYSAALGLIYFVFRRPIISPKIWIACLSATALLGIALSTYASQLMGLWASSFDPRITIYALALDSEILNTAQFNFHTAVTIALVSLCITNGLYKWTTFEIAALKFVIVGVFFYMTLFWLPVVGLRGLELFTSLLPVVGAAGYKSSKSLTMRAIILIMFVALFLNSVVRNGLMLDLVLPGQPQESLLNDR